MLTTFINFHQGDLEALRNECLHGHVCSVIYFSYQSTCLQLAMELNNMGHDGGNLNLKTLKLENIIYIFFHLEHALVGHFI